MLTKEEANNLIEQLCGCMLERGINNFKKDCSPNDIIFCVSNFIEKPKEEINLLMSGCIMLKDKAYVLTIREMEDAD